MGHAGVVALVAVGRRGEAQHRFFAGHQQRDHASVGCIAADQTMLAQLPDITETRDGRSRNFRHVIGGVGRIRILFIPVADCNIANEQLLDLRVIEACERKVVASLG